MFSSIHPINLYHKDDINFLVCASILMHRMIIKVLVENDKVESADMYNTLSVTKEESSGVYIEDSYSKGVEDLEA